VIILRMVKGRRCRGCSESRRVDAKTGLCGYCAALAIEVTDRKAKLNGTVEHLFAEKLSEISVKLAKFNSMGRAT
jgi:hypothetical protein